MQASNTQVNHKRPKKLKRYEARKAVQQGLVMSNLNVYESYVYNEIIKQLTIIKSGRGYITARKKIKEIMKEYSQHISQGLKDFLNNLIRVTLEEATPLKV